MSPKLRSQQIQQREKANDMQLISSVGSAIKEIRIRDIMETFYSSRNQPCHLIAKYADLTGWPRSSIDAFQVQNGSERLQKAMLCRCSKTRRNLHTIEGWFHVAG